jgi:hypothetical protein
MYLFDQSGNLRLRLGEPAMGWTPTAADRTILKLAASESDPVVMRASTVAGEAI